MSLFFSPNLIQNRVKYQLEITENNALKILKIIKDS